MKWGNCIWIVSKWKFRDPLNLIKQKYIHIFSWSVKEGPTSGNHKIAKASAKMVNRDGEKESIATRPPTEKIPKNMDFIGIYVTLIKAPWLEMSTSTEFSIFWRIDLGLLRTKFWERKGNRHFKNSDTRVVLVWSEVWHITFYYYIITIYLKELGRKSAEQAWCLRPMFWELAQLLYGCNWAKTWSVHKITIYVMDIHLSNVFFISTNHLVAKREFNTVFFYVFILHKKDHLRFNFFLKSEHEQKAWTYSALNIQRTLPRTVVSPICCVKNRKISTDDILLVVQLASQQGWCSYEMCVVRYRRGVFVCNTWLTEMEYIPSLSFKYDIWNFFSETLALNKLAMAF